MKHTGWCNYTEVIIDIQSDIWFFLSFQISRAREKVCVRVYRRFKMEISDLS